MSTNSEYKLYVALPEEMKEVAGHLQKIHGPLKGDRPQKKPDGRLRRNRPARSGKNLFLFYLVKLVEACTGHAHYQELATLVNSIKPDTEGGRSPRALEKVVARFAKDNPSDASFLTGQAEEQASEWHNSTPDKSTPLAAR